MAIMVPQGGPAECTPESKEAEMYWALAEALDDGYIVIHSRNEHQPNGNGGLQLRETDFVIAHRDKGVLYVEAKNTKPIWRGGEWFYPGGAPMNGGLGPYRAALRFKTGAIARQRQLGLTSASIGDVKQLEAVWFYGARRSYFDGQDLPGDARLDLTITRDDGESADSLKARIDGIFDAEYQINGKLPLVHDVTDAQWRTFVDKFLLPESGVVTLDDSYGSVVGRKLVSLTAAQARVLDYLRFEKRAAINGIGGSGKTVIAVEKARRLAEDGERVLLLCSTRKLGEELSRRCSGTDGIDAMTFDAFASKMGCRGGGAVDCEALALKLMDGDETFAYDHVVIDEAQEFGGDIEDFGVLDALGAAIGPDGRMFVFYDELQVLNFERLPKSVEGFRCRLALYVNCRNTRQIAETALASVAFDNEFEVMEGADGHVPRLHIGGTVEERAAQIDAVVARYSKEGVAKSDVVVLTTGKIEDSEFVGLLQGPKDAKTWKGGKVRFDTVRKFKGLEASGVILVDVDRDVWLPDTRDPGALQPGVEFYAGASRAKMELDAFLDMGDDECNDVLEALGGQRVREPFKMLAKRLKAELVRH